LEGPSETKDRGVVSVNSKDLSFSKQITNKDHIFDKVPPLRISRIY